MNNLSKTADRDLHGDMEEEYEPSDSRADRFNTPRKWKQALVMLNAAHEFQRVSEMRKIEDEKKKKKKKLIGKMRAHARVASLAVNFRDKKLVVKESEIRKNEIGITSKELVAMSKEKDLSFLELCGGVKGLAEKLETNLVEGLPKDATIIENRKTIYGSNTYPPVKNCSKSFMKFVSESCGDSNLIILMVSAVACSAIGIKIEGVKEGWYEGGSIVLAVVTAIIFKAVKNYQDFLQSHTSKKNIQIEVVRGGIPNKISKSEIVVGDIVVLKIGEEVPADGLVVSSYSLILEESRINKETKIIHKDGAKDPFVMAGSRVVDGHGTMLVTSVGMSTQLMTSKSKVNGEEDTPKKERRSDVVTLFGGIFGVIISTMILIALIIRLFNRHHINPFGSFEMIAAWAKYGNVVNTFMKVFTVAVTILAYGKKKKTDSAKDTIKRVNSTRPKPKRSHVYLCIP